MRLFDFDGLYIGPDGPEEPYSLASRRSRLRAGVGRFYSTRAMLA